MNSQTIVVCQGHGGGSKASSIRHVAFFDEEACWWREREEGAEDLVATRPYRALGAVFSGCLIIAVSDGAVMSVDCSDGSVRELCAGLEGKIVSGVDLLPVCGIGAGLSFACSDGFVRVVDPLQRKIVRIFSQGKSTKPLTNVATLMRADNSVGIFASCGENALYWKWGEPEHTLQVLHAGGEIEALCRVPGRKHVATVGEDKCVCVWDLTHDPAEAYRIKPNTKHPLAYSSVAAFIIPNPVGVCFAVWSAKEHGRVSLMSARTHGGDVRQMHLSGVLEDLMAHCGVTEKKASAKFKVYGIRCVCILVQR